MGYLYMTIVLAAWTAMAFIYRWSERRQADRMIMAAAMGAAGTVCAAAYALGSGVHLSQAHPSQWIIGIGLGCVAAAGIPLFLAAVSRGDLSITWTILTLSFSVASVGSMIYPGAHPTALGLAGLVLAAVAVVFLGLDMYLRHRSDGPGKPRKGWALFMALSFTTNALSLYAYVLAEALPKAGGRVLDPAQSDANTACFLLTMYGVFAVVAMGASLVSGVRGKPGAGVVVGLLGGAVLCVGSFGFMFALGVKNPIPAYLLYPITNGGSSILVAVLSFVFLKERPNLCGWAGIIVGFAALVCLSLAPPAVQKALMDAIRHLLGGQ